MSGGLSIHCVDVASGRVAAGLRVAVQRLGPDGLPQGPLIAEGTVGSNGLLAHPALMSEAITAGGYEVRFEVGAFYRGQGSRDGGIAGHTRAECSGTYRARVGNGVAPFFHCIDDHDDLIVFQHIDDMRSAFGYFIDRLHLQTMLLQIAGCTLGSA